MHYVVIAHFEDRLESRVVEGANQAINLRQRYQIAGAERVTMTDGDRFFSFDQMMSMTDADRS